MKLLAACPLCNNNNLTEFLACKDNSVSHETFTLQRCPACDFVFTNPRPEDTELGRYYESENYISHANRSASLMDRVYRIARTYTVRWKYRVVRSNIESEGKSILDYGCGTGTFLHYCQKQGMTIAGVEPSLKARTTAADLTHAPIHATLEDVTGNFDAITLWHVLEHVSNLSDTIEALKTRLAKNGTMFIAVPNHKSTDANMFKQHWAAFDVPRHLWHFSIQTMTSLVTQHGMRVTNVMPMRLDAYYVAMLSEKYKSGKSGIVTTANALLKGFRSNQAASKTNEFSSLIYLVKK